MASKSLTTSEFIERAISVHGYRYDYSLCEYTRLRDRVNIVCNIHGAFSQVAARHLDGRNCPTCHLRRTTTESFIEKSKIVHDNKYDYSLVDYKNGKTNIEIVCLKHGVFSQRASHHLEGRGCPLCSHERRTLTTEEFIEKAIAVHGDLYDYSTAKYTLWENYISIICKNHGVFSQTVQSHINGTGCPKCASDSRKLTQTEFIEKAKSVHGELYDYSLVNYILSSIRVKIICNIHGEFNQTPNSHLMGVGCRFCSFDVKRKSQETFIEESMVTHNGKYDYSLVEYKSSAIKVNIICPTHGSFFQKPHSHSSGYGCNECGIEERAAQSISKPELEICQTLEKNDIVFEFQKTFEDCQLKRRLIFDFFIPALNTIIEYDGQQHFQPVEHWGGEKVFQEIQQRDSIKNEYCLYKKINLIRIRYDESISEVLKAKIIHN